MAKKEPTKAWYKVTIQHGPGHQSETILYRFSYPEWIEDEIEIGPYRNAIAKWQKIRKLPKEAANEMIAKHKARIKNSRDLIALIKEASK